MRVARKTYTTTPRPLRGSGARVVRWVRSPPYPGWRWKPTLATASFRRIAQAIDGSGVEGWVWVRASHASALPLVRSGFSSAT